VIDQEINGIISAQYDRPWNPERETRAFWKNRSPCSLKRKPSRAMN